jgi:hypothetical protein
MTRTSPSHVGKTPLHVSLSSSGVLSLTPVEIDEYHTSPDGAQVGTRRSPDGGNVKVTAKLQHRLCTEFGQVGHFVAVAVMSSSATGNRNACHLHAAAAPV